MNPELLNRVTRLRNDAKDARTKKKFTIAIKKLEEAIEDLKDELSAVRRTPSADKCQILKELSESYGSLGGTQRDSGELRKALDCYNEGNKYEGERRRDCNAQDTYNLLQRLVIQLLIDPVCIEQPDFVNELECVRDVIRAQVDAGRNDSWALADLILAQFLSGTDADAVLAELEKRQAEKTFYKSTYDVVEALIVEGLGRGSPLEGRLEAFRRLLQRKGGLALSPQPSAR
jgi:tetratricopeptide (TPR) repeat protein